MIRMCVSVQPVKNPAKTDDVLGVVNHMDHLVTLLLIETRASYESKPCQDYLLSQNMLETICVWSTQTGR